ALVADTLLTRKHPLISLSTASNPSRFRSISFLLALRPNHDYSARSVVPVHVLGRNSRVRRIEFYARNFRRPRDLIELCPGNARTVNPEQRHATANADCVSTKTRCLH